MVGNVSFPKHISWFRKRDYLQVKDWREWEFHSVFESLFVSTKWLKKFFTSKSPKKLL